MVAAGGEYQRYAERRKEDREGCVICGSGLDDIPIPRDDDDGYHLEEQCSSDPDHEDRRKSIKCGCGKWRCPGPGDPKTQLPNGIWACVTHPDLASPENNPHHTDGTQACETNYRTPEQQADWEVGHAKWKDARKRLPDLAAVLSRLDAEANPLSFDGHDVFHFVSKNPEEAAICIHKMYKTIRGIAVGATAMRDIPTLGNFDD